jgi:poly [ADP-ribose] polymerase
MSDVIEKVKLIMADIDNNNNKVWIGSLHNDGTVVCEWGRVGKNMQSKTFPNAGESFLRKKEREKEKKGYKKLNVVDSETPINKTTSKSVSNSNISSLAKKQIVKDKNPIVTNLINYLAKENAHQIIAATSGGVQYNDTTGLFSTPLGVINQDNIDEANDLLIEIGDLVSNKSYGERLKSLSNEYLVLVPTDIGMQRFETDVFWSNVSRVQAQKKILDGLQASLDQALTQKPTKKKKSDDPSIFNIDIAPVTDKRFIKKTFDDFNATKSSAHSLAYQYKPKQMWSLDIKSMSEAYSKVGENMGCKLECYHGSSAGNLLSIFSKGFMIPSTNSSHVTGRMFGNGLYGAPLRHKGKTSERIRNTSTKALNYAVGGWGKASSSRVFMFLVEFAMGKYYTPSGSMYQDRCPKGYDSTWAHPRSSGVRNHEVIVYNLAQAKPTHLIEFEK